MGNITKKRISYLGICLVILAILIFATYQNARPTSPEPNVIATATEVEGPSLKVEVESEETATPSLNVEVKSEETATPIPETPLTPISDISAREETPTATLAAVSLVEDKTSWTGRWVALDTTGGGGQMGIAPHPTNPDIVYIASDNAGLFKTENGGDRWFSVSSNLGAYRLGFVILDPLDPDIIYVTATSDFGHRDEGGGSGEMHRSLNGGLTWEFLTDAMGFQSSFPSQSSLVIPYDPDNPERFDKDGDNLSDVIVVGAWTGPADPPVGGIWRSEDEGQTFKQVALHDRNVIVIKGSPQDTDLLHATTFEGEIYRSGDMGESWTEITGNVPLENISDLVVHPMDFQVLFVTCRECQPGVPPVWKTNDDGQTWQPTSTGLDTNEVGGFPKLLIDRLDPEIMYVTTDEAPRGLGGVYKSTDGGKNWTLMPSVLVFPDGRPYHKFDLEGKFAIGQSIDGRLYAGGTSGVLRYPDGNQDDNLDAWEPATIGLGNVHVNSIEVDPTDPGVLYQGLSDLGPYKSIDQGKTFHRILGTGWPVTVENFVWNGPYYSNYEYCMLSCSADCSSNGRIAGGGATGFAISNQDTNVIYSTFGSGSGQSAHGGVNKSTDGGATWVPVGFQLENGFELNQDSCVPYGFRYLEMVVNNDQVVFAAQENPETGEGILYKTTNGGDIWEKVYVADRFMTGLAVSPLDPDLVVFTTRIAAYKSEQGGAPDSWQEMTPDGVTNIRTIRLSPHQRDVFVIGSHVQGIYYTDDGGQTWQQNALSGLFRQQVSQDNEEILPPDIATAFNTNQEMLKNISSIIFDPVEPDAFYVGSRQPNRAGFGVAKITNAGQNWDRLPLEGMTYRNVFDMAIDSKGQYLYIGTFNGTYMFNLR